MGIKFWFAVIMGITSAMTTRGDIVNVFGGTYSSWPAAWTSLGINDGDDSITTRELEIMGDTFHPAVQYAQDNSYIYFRLQLGTDTFNTGTVNGSYLIYVDRLGAGNEDGRPNFAIAWDAKSNDNANHGLEMTRYLTGAGTWGTLRMQDVDGAGSSNVKGPEDINGNSRTGDGYARVLRQQAGASGSAANSYVEMAVAWNYLENNSTTGLDHGQSWRIGAGTIRNATDHGLIDQFSDVAGGLNYDGSLAGGWSGSIGTVPEIPASPWVVLGFIGLVAGGGRLRSRFKHWWFSRGR
jgi:hypothetical protein